MKKHTSNYHLSRDTQARRALFRNLIESLVRKEKIMTTATKAYATRPIFEELLTKAKAGTVAKIRAIHAVIPDNKLVRLLVHEIAPRYKDIQGGYTTIKRYGFRRGDNAPLVVWQLTKTKATKSSQPKEVQPKTATANLSEPKKTPPKKLVQPSVPQATKQVKSVKLAPSRAGKRGDK